MSHLQTTFTMKQLLEAGVHYGHTARRWNPKMEEFIYGTRQGVHILDLRKTMPMMYQALQTLKQVVENGGRVLFVGTKRQAAEPIAEAATKCAQHYVNFRWPGGMLTNWQTISKSLDRLKQLDDLMGQDQEETGLTKKETLQMMREREKLNRALGGIREMGGQPDILFVIDTNKEQLAIAEANKLGIPVVGIVDTNADPDHIDYPVPGNDDAGRAIQFYCDLVADVVLEGIQSEMKYRGGDFGSSENPPAESATEAPKAGVTQDEPEDKPKDETAETATQDGADEKTEEATKDTSDSKTSDAAEKRAASA